MSFRSEWTLENEKTLKIWKSLILELEVVCQARRCEKPKPNLLCQWGSYVLDSTDSII